MLIQDEKVQRTFIIGDEWIYYKIYSGNFTLDKILISIIKPVISDLNDRGLISKWFFIRYADPDLHIRLRLQIKNSKNLNEIIKIFHHQFSPLIKNDEINSLLIDTYKREIERYGEEYIELAEKIFCFDSNCTINILDIINQSPNLEFRWLSCLVSIDRFLNDLSFKLNAKYELLKYSSKSLNSEFYINSEFIKNLSKLYRQHKKDIYYSLKTDSTIKRIPVEVTNQFNIRSTQTKSLLTFLSESQENPIIPKNHILSQIHMIVNRFFNAKQKQYELIIYNFLTRYYKSEIARTKYNTY